MSNVHSTAHEQPGGRATGSTRATRCAERFCGFTAPRAGVLMLAIIENAMNLKNIDPFYQYVIRGSILLLAVVIDRMKQR